MPLYVGASSTRWATVEADSKNEHEEKESSDDNNTNRKEDGSASNDEEDDGDGTGLAALKDISPSAEAFLSLVSCPPSCTSHLHNRSSHIRVENTLGEVVNVVNASVVMEMRRAGETGV